MWLRGVWGGGELLILIIIATRGVWIFSGIPVCFETPLYGVYGVSSLIKRHLLILFACTVLVRGVMFVSYPLGAQDDDQSYQRFVVKELLEGNLLIGNVRFNTGYPLIIAPIQWLGDHFGAVNDRVVLLFQLLCSALIPFLLYDILRLRGAPRTGFVIGLVSVFDVFGLQWAHFSLPGWMVAVLMVVAVWCVQRALLAPRRAWLWTAAAGLAFGWAALGRTEATFAALILGVSLLALPKLAWGRKVGMFITFGGTSFGVLVAYLALIQYPSTGIWLPSCMAGTNLLKSDKDRGIPLVAANGPTTQRLLSLLTLKPPRTILLQGEASYPYWRIPGPWITGDDRANFLSQTPGVPDSVLNTTIPVDLIAYLGPCEVDKLLQGTHAEALAAHPGEWLTTAVADFLRISAQAPWDRINNMYLPAYPGFIYDAKAGTFGFYRVYTPEFNFYTGQIVWIPGVWLYSQAFVLLNLVKLLTPLALVWALVRKNWLFRTGALMTIAYLAFVVVFNGAQPRIYAPPYPLVDLAVGSLLAWLLLSRRAGKFPV